jgi:hypothetical protein
VQAFVYPKMVHAFANHRRPDTYDRGGDESGGLAAPSRISGNG